MAIQHAKQSTDLRVNSLIWIRCYQNDQTRNKPTHRPREIQAGDKCLSGIHTLFWDIILVSARMACTHHVPDLQFLRLILRAKSMCTVCLLADCGHPMTSGGQEFSQRCSANLTFILPSSNSILHLSTATKSNRRIKRWATLLCLFFFFWLFRIHLQNLLSPRGLHTNSVALLEKRTVINISLYHTLMIDIWFKQHWNKCLKPMNSSKLFTR